MLRNGTCKKIAEWKVINSIVLTYIDMEWFVNIELIFVIIIIICVNIIIPIYNTNITYNLVIDGYMECYKWFNPLEREDFEDKLKHRCYFYTKLLIKHIDTYHISLSDRSPSIRSHRTVYTTSADSADSSPSFEHAPSTHDASASFVHVHTTHTNQHALNHTNKHANNHQIHERQYNTENSHRNHDRSSWLQEWS